MHTFLLATHPEPLGVPLWDAHTMECYSLYKTTWIFATIGTSGKNTNLREKKPDTEDKLNPIGGMCFSDLLKV